MTSSLLKCGDWMGWWVWKLHTQTSVLAQNLRAKMRISIKMVWLAGSQSMFVQHDRTEIKTQRASRQDKPWCLGLKHFFLLSFGKQLSINLFWIPLQSTFFPSHFPFLGQATKRSHWVICNSLQTFTTFHLCLPCPIYSFSFWASKKQAAMNSIQVSYVGGREPSTWPPFDAFPSASWESWLGSGIAGMPTSALIRDSSVINNGLIHCTTMPAPNLGLKLQTEWSFYGQIRACQSFASNPKGFMLLWGQASLSLQLHYYPLFTKLLFYQLPRN